MVTKRVFHNGELHELLLRSELLCADCRYLQLGQCRLFGVAVGLRPAVCEDAEGEARSSGSRTVAEGIAERSTTLRSALEALAKRESQR